MSGGTAYKILWGADGLMYVGGDMTAAGGRTAANLAIWNGSNWCHFPAALPGSSVVYDILITEQGDFYLGYSGNGTATTSKVTTVTNNGTAETYPIFKIKSTSTTSTLKYLKNLTTGKTIWISYAIQPGEELLIDFRPGTRLTCGAPTAARCRPRPGRWPSGRTVRSSGWVARRWWGRTMARH